MPTYEYECTACGHRFEESQRMTDAPLEVCPKCRGRLRRLISAGSGIIFRGAGFYATDYRRSASPPARHEPPALPEKKTDPKPPDAATR